MTTRSNALVRPPTASGVKAAGKYRKGNNPAYGFDRGVTGSRKRALKGLSRMKGNFQVRFLGGGVAAMRSCYPTQNSATPS
jgi:hypothetical protein